jgi:cryptochrome
LPIPNRFLTRGGLWYNWEIGAEYFWKHLIDADWAVNAGNWMWVSSSAFERLLDSSKCTCPVAFGRRLDPNGEYIKRYVPELRNLPISYIHQPWKAPSHVQESAECVIGVHYPAPIIDFLSASQRNQKTMKEIRSRLINETPAHVRPSDENEIRRFFWLADERSIEVKS